MVPSNYVPNRTGHKTSCPDQELAERSTSLPISCSIKTAEACNATCLTQINSDRSFSLVRVGLNGPSLTRLTISPFTLNSTDHHVANLFGSWLQKLYLLVMLIVVSVVCSGWCYPLCHRSSFFLRSLIWERSSTVALFSMPR